MTELKIEQWPIERCIPYCRNPRKNDDAVPKMAGLIKEFGFKVPIVARSDGEVIDGHLRLKAAQFLHMETVPVVLADDWTPAQVKAFRLAVNKSAEWAEWDEDLLKLEIEDLKLEDFDLELIGFDEISLDDEGTEGLTDPDEVPEVQETPVSKLGDIWLLGNHRLMCGDSTDAGSVALLMNGEKADMVFTDPPYGVAYKVKASASDGKTISIARKNILKNETIENDGTLEKAYEVSQKVFALCKEIPIFYVCCDWKSYPTIKQTMNDAGIEQKALIVWDKGGPYQHLDLFAKRHEFIIYAGEYGGVPTADTDIWSFPREFRSDHPTPKPVNLVAHAIGFHKKVHCVYDPFGGSGSTLIACEKTGRVCRMMELSPHYVDVIVRRWQDFTGNEATLESSSKTFAQVQEERG